MPYNTVMLKSYGPPVQKEGTLAAAATPGMLCERTTTDGQFQVHSTANGFAQKIFVIEDALQGNDINDAYSTNDRARFWYPHPGDEVNAILVDGENVSIGDELVSNGDGKLKKIETGDSFLGIEQSVVAVALEALDLSDSSGAESSGAIGYDKRLRVEVV